MKILTLKNLRRSVAIAAGVALMGVAAPAWADTAGFVQEPGDTISVEGNFGHIDHVCGTTETYSGTLRVTWTSGTHFRNGTAVTAVTQNAVNEYAISGSATAPAAWETSPAGSTFDVPVTVTVKDSYANGNLNFMTQGTKANGQAWTNGAPTFRITVDCLPDPTPPPDTTPPTVTCDEPDTSAWYGSNQSVNCTASDSGSGLADAADASFSLSTDVADGDETDSASTGSKTVCDAAGNCADPVGPYTFMVDRKSPSLSPSVSPNPVILNGTATATANASDGGSGIASEGCDAVDTSTVGAQSVDCDATDNVGNAGSASARYTVVYGDCGGTGLKVRQPINDTRNGQAVSQFKQGSTVPVKFRACDAHGNSIGAAGVVSSFALVSKSAGAAGVEESTPPSTTPDTQFRWDSTDSQWIFNLSTKSYSKNATYNFEIRLNDGVTVIPFSLALK